MKATYMYYNPSTGDVISRYNLTKMLGLAVGAQDQIGDWFALYDGDEPEYNQYTQKVEYDSITEENGVYVRNYKAVDLNDEERAAMVTVHATVETGELMSIANKYAVSLILGNDTQQAKEEYMEKLATIDDDVAEQMPSMFPNWSAGKEYKTGDRVIYDGTMYKVLQDHTSQETWTPTGAPSLFAKLLTDPTGETIKEWEQPDSTNPYMKGDKVTFEGKTYESLIDNNVWSPSTYPAGWSVVE